VRGTMSERGMAAAIVIAFVEMRARSGKGVYLETVDDVPSSYSHANCGARV